MKVVLKTNIDAYSRYVHIFPTFDYIPNVEDMVEIRRDFHVEFEKKRLPIELKVVSVRHREDGDGDAYAIVELHYSEQQVKAAKISGINLFP